MKKKYLTVLLIVFGLQKCFSQTTLFTLDSVGNVKSELHSEQDANYKLINDFEKCTYKEGIDTIRIKFNGKKFILVKHVSNYMKTKTEQYDESMHLLTENFFDTVRFERYKSIDRNVDGEIVSSYEQKDQVTITSDYNDSGTLSHFNVFDEKNNHIIFSALFDSTGGLRLFSKYLCEDNLLQTTSYYIGSQQKVVEYFEGNKPAPYFEYHPDGKIRTKGKIIGMPINFIGVWQNYYPDGSLESENKFDEKIPNYKVGIWSYWDKHGNLIKQEVYENNKLIETKEFLPNNIKNKE